MSQDLILLIAAMESEADPLIQKMGLKAAGFVDPRFPVIYYSGEFASKKVILVIHGKDPKTNTDMVGTQAATLATLVALQRFSPSQLINFGTCGALSKRGAKIGDIYLIKGKVVYHSRRIPLGKWWEYGIGGYSVLGNEELAQKINVKTGVLSSTDSLEHNLADSKMFELVNADVADMEGAAIAWVAEFFNVPFYSIKGVTDLMDLEVKTGEQFKANLEPLANQISEKVLLLLNVI
jgi:nucleoside phosphorylase